jgi:DNA polymerase III delta prime subunit
MQSKLFTTNHTASNDEVAKLLEKELAIKFLNNPDVKEINRAGESLKIETVRQIKSDLLYPPLVGEVRSFILYDFHLATLPAQNALLKTLEEPPEYAQFVLASSNLNSILPTIKSRCTVKILENTDGEEQGQKNSAQIKEIYQQINNGSYADKIGLVTGYKGKTEAIKLLEELLRFLHSKNSEQPTPTSTRHLQILDEHLVYLKGNSNVTLAMTECFFKMK